MEILTIYPFSGIRKRWGSPSAYSGIVTPPDFEAEEPIVRSLLDANGLEEVPVSEVKKIVDPGEPHQQQWYIDLRDRGLTQFVFPPAVKNMKAYQIISISDNDIENVPKGLQYKKWMSLGLKGNRLCNLTRQDTLTLDSASSFWRESQRCPPRWDPLFPLRLTFAEGEAAF